MFIVQGLPCRKERERQSGVDFSGAASKVMLICLASGLRLGGSGGRTSAAVWMYVEY